MKNELLKAGKVIILASLVGILFGIIAVSCNDSDTDREPKTKHKTKIVYKYKTKTSYKKSKVNKTADKNISSSNITSPKVSHMPKEKVNKTLAKKAYKKLHNVNMKNEAYLLAIEILTDLEVTVNPIKEKKIEGLFGDSWEQTFEFSDKSKIVLTKMQNEEKEFIFMPMKTKIIK